MTRTDAIIVGGGISGLAAAHALARRGVPFLLLEAADRFGGVIRTEREGGFLLEAGPDSMLAQKPEGADLCRELGLGDRLVPTSLEHRKVYVLHGGRLHALPDGMVLAIPTRILPFLASGLFSPLAKLRMGLDLVRPARRDGADESVASFLRRRFGQECVERLGEPLLAGIHSGDPERLSIRATFPRFVELEARYGSLVRGMWAAPKPKGPPAAPFHSLLGGMVELVDALVAQLPAGSLRAGTPVRGVRREDGFRVETDQGVVQARTLVLAVPPAKAAPLLESLVPEAGPALRAVPSASTATVLLGFRREDVAHPLDGYGLVVPATEGRATAALTFASTKLPGRAPDGHVLLRGFVGGVRDPGALSGDDATLLDTVRRDMQDVLGLRGAPVVARVFRWPEATPQMEVGHLARMASLDARLAAVPGLHVGGAGLRVTGVPDCVAEGTRLAEAAAAYLAPAGRSS
ncbi:MAG TPA: protoporphyrinogen oxidase [Vicinamibacteria bacterium]|nr:protoporphyrinogen oxidase [Vicinamibacteria bacterium]